MFFNIDSFLKNIGKSRNKFDCSNDTPSPLFLFHMLIILSSGQNCQGFRKTIQNKATERTNTQKPKK